MIGDALIEEKEYCLKNTSTSILNIKLNHKQNKKSFSI